MTIRPYVVNVGKHRSNDFVPKKHGLIINVLSGDSSDTWANLRLDTAVNAIIGGFAEDFQSTILQLEALFREMQSVGIPNVNPNQADYERLRYFNQAYESAIGGLAKATYAPTDTQVDVNAVPAPDEPHWEEYQQRLGIELGNLAWKRGVPGVNRLWDAAGDVAQIDLMSMIDLLAEKGKVLGSLLQTGAFGIVDAKQFSHRLTDISIGKENSLPEYLEYLSRANGIALDVNFVVHGAIITHANMPNLINTIKDSLLNHFMLSKAGIDFGRKFFGHKTFELKDGNKLDMINIFQGFGSDTFSANDLDISVTITQSIHLLIQYTRAVNALFDLLNHSHTSWVNIKEYAKSLFSEVGLSSFSGYADFSLPVGLWAFALSDDAYANDWYSTFERWDEPTDFMSLLNASISTVDANQSLFVDYMSESELLDIKAFSSVFIMEENALTIYRYKTGGLIWMIGGQEVGWVVDDDTTTVEGRVCQGSLDHAIFDTLFDMEFEALPIATVTAAYPPDDVQEYLRRMLSGDEVRDETIEIQFAHSQDVNAELYLKAFSLAKQEFKESIKDVDKTDGSEQTGKMP
jgi:hypothetical protein